MNPGDKVFVFPKRDVRDGDWARIVLATPNNDALYLVSVRGEDDFRLILLRDEKTHPFWRDIFTEDLYGISVEAKVDAAAASEGTKKP